MSLRATTGKMMRWMFISLIWSCCSLATWAQVDKGILDTLDGSGAKDTSTTNKPPEKVENEDPGKENRGIPPENIPEAKPPEGEKPEEKEPESLPDVGEPGALPPPEEVKPEEEEKPGGGGTAVDPKEEMPPPESEDKNPGSGTTEKEEEKEEPYIPTEKLGAGSAVDFPVDI